MASTLEDALADYDTLTAGSLLKRMPAIDRVRAARRPPDLAEKLLRVVRCSRCSLRLRCSPRARRSPCCRS